MARSRTAADGPEKARGPSERALMGTAILVMVVLTMLVLVNRSAEGAGSGDYPPPAAGDWVITADTQVWDEAIVLRGDLVVRPGASIELDRVLLAMNCSYAGQYHIEVLDGGGLDVADSNLTALDTGSPYYIVVRENGTFAAVNTTFEWMGWDDAELYEQLGLAIFSNRTTISGNRFQFNRAGLYIEGATPAIDGNLFVDNFYGAWVYDAGIVSFIGDNFRENNVGLLVDGSMVALYGCDLIDNNLKGLASLSSVVLMDETSIVGTREIALSGWDTDILMVNGTLEGDTYGLVLDKDSYMMCYNGTIDRYDVVFKDYLSHLTVYWYIDIEVLWWSDMGPVANATVNVTDSGGTSIGNGTTGADGMLRDLLVPGYDANRSKFVFYTPIDITANSSGLVGNTTAVLEGPLTATVMIDDIAPGINVTNPPMGEFYNKAIVDLRGVMWDNETGPSHVEISLDDGNYTMANGTTIWNLTVELGEGLHKVIIRAWDIAGNPRTLKFYFTVDTVPPVVVIGAPGDGLVTNLTYVWVNGSTELAANITVRGEVVISTDGTFGLFLDLVEGDNIIMVNATDRAGNVGSAMVHVIRDTRVDPLVLDPVNDTSTNDRNLALGGHTEPWTYLRLTWRTLNVTGNNTTVVQHNITIYADADGNFKFNLVLVEGVNNFTLYAKDRLNNTKLLNLTYHLDSTPPTLVLTSPSSIVHYTNKNGVNIKGYTEDGARVYLGDQELLLYDLRFSLRVEVYIGVNNFTLWAVDDANNTVRMNLTIIVDKEPPFLNISRPFEPVVKTTGRYITISGHTEPNATVLVNGASFSVREDGYFSVKRSLVFGKNRFTITAKDQAGNPTSVDRTVIREKPSPNMTRYYIGISIPVVALVVLLLVTLLYLNRKGNLDGVKRFLRRDKGEDDLEDLEDEPPADLEFEGHVDDGSPPPMPDAPTEGKEEVEEEGPELETTEKADGVGPPEEKGDKKGPEKADKKEKKGKKGWFKKGRGKD